MRIGISLQRMCRFLCFVSSSSSQKPRSMNCGLAILKSVCRRVFAVCAVSYLLRNSTFRTVTHADLGRLDVENLSSITFFDINHWTPQRKVKQHIDNFLQQIHLPSLKDLRLKMHGSTKVLKFIRKAVKD